MKNNETKVVCPVCGTEFAIANHSHVATGMVVGKDSGLGTIELPVAKVGNKADDRLKALRDAGIDTSNLFAMHTASGEGMLVRMSGGQISQVDDNDPIFSGLACFGTIPERRLFRRWITAQVLHMLSYENRWNGKKGYTDALHNLGYDYQWKMLEEELRVQSKLAGNDVENFMERNQFFNTGVVNAMFHEYLEALTKYVSKIKCRKCKGIPYKRIPGFGDVFCSDLDAKVYGKFRPYIAKTVKTVGIHDLYVIVRNFNRERIHFAWSVYINIPQHKSWVDAYKGAGAYYAMKNLILFSGCKLKSDGVTYNREESIEILKSRAKLYEGEGWRLLAMLKKLLDDNNFNIEAKREEWAEVKKARKSR